jgi:ABC-2 type transport system ATP-binding protein
VDEEGLVVNVRDGDASAPALLKLLIESDMEVARLAVSRPTLDDVFLKHTGRTIRGDSADGDAYDQTFRQSMGVRRQR